MGQYHKLPISVLDTFPGAEAEAVHGLFLEELRDFHRKIVVLDDDPTGVQTVHGVSVYTDWEQESLMEGIQEENNMFFILTNSRSFSAQKTEEEHRLITERSAKAAAALRSCCLFPEGIPRCVGIILWSRRCLRKRLRNRPGRLCTDRYCALSS